MWCGCSRFSSHVWWSHLLTEHQHHLFRFQYPVLLRCGSHDCYEHLAGYIWVFLSTETKRIHWQRPSRELASISTHRTKNEPRCRHFIRRLWTPVTCYLCELCKFESMLKNLECKPWIQFVSTISFFTFNDAMRIFLQFFYLFQTFFSLLDRCDLVIKWSYFAAPHCIFGQSVSLSVWRTAHEMWLNTR